MPLNHGAKAANEHLIFVKNVPGYIGTDAIRGIFEKYNPMSVKNVYPNSNVTTVVVGFRTKAEATRAQEETDQTRLSNVVLKVEMYNQRQSVRYLRDQGQANRPLGMVKDDEAEYFDEEPSQEDAPVSTPPLEPYVARDFTVAPQGTTWADIAGNRLAPVKEAPKMGGADSTTTAPCTPTSTPRMPIAVPQKLFAPSHQQSETSPPPAAVSLGYSTPDAVAIPPPLSGRSTDTSSTDEMEERVRKFGEIVNWQAVTQWATESSNYRDARGEVEPFDTTARIRARHRRDCLFCRKREQSAQS
jgi:hypothetical protein